MAIYDIYPTGLPHTNPLFSNRGSYGWSSMSLIDDYSMPIHTWSLEQSFGKILAKYKNYINLNNIGTSEIPIASGYFSRMGFSGQADWWNNTDSIGINKLYTKYLHVEATGYFHNSNSPTYGTFANNVWVKSIQEKWEEINPTILGGGWWYSDISLDGTGIIVAEYGKRAYLSYNDGLSWTEVQPAGDKDRFWSNVQISSGADKLCLFAINGGIYYSSDYGLNWSEITPYAANSGWLTADMSPDGSKIIVAGYRIYYSPNSGSSWSELQPAGNENRYWGTCSLSDDGTYMIAGVKDTLVGQTSSYKKIYQSSNSGLSWTQIFPDGDGIAYWYKSQISNDGKYILTASILGGMGTYFSNDSGVTWSGIPITWYSEEDQSWNAYNIPALSMEMLGDGSKIILGDNYGPVCYSNDYGMTWEYKFPQGREHEYISHHDVNLTSNGTKLLEAEYYYNTAVNLFNSSVGASSHISNTIVDNITSWDNDYFSSNNSEFDRTNIYNHTHKDILTLPGLSGTLYYIKPTEINLSELNLRSGRLEFISSGQIQVNSGVYIHTSGLNLIVPEANFMFVSGIDSHRHDGVSGRILTTESIGDLVNNIWYSGIYSGFIIQNQNATGLLQGCTINYSGDFTKVWSYDTGAPNIYSFQNSLVLSKNNEIYKNNNSDLSWSIVYEDFDTTTHNNIDNPMTNQNKFRIWDNKLWHARRGSIINTEDLITWESILTIGSGFSNGILINGLLNFSVSGLGSIYYSGGSFYNDITPTGYAPFMFHNNKLYVPENYNPLKYKENVYYSTSGKLYAYTISDFSEAVEVYDIPGFSDGAVLKNYGPRMYIGADTSLYSFYNNEFKLEQTTDSKINDMHVFSGLLYIACCSGLYRKRDLLW